MKILSLLMFLMLSVGCTTVKYKDTYIKYSGYMDGCADAATLIILSMRQDLTEDQINPVWLDTMCMDLYLKKLEKENIQPPMERVDRNEVI